MKTSRLQMENKIVGIRQKMEFLVLNAIDIHYTEA